MRVIDRVREKTDTVLLYYSAGGKDSIALLDMVAPKFKKVICVHEYLIKGLKHFQPYFDWIKRYGNCELMLVEHPIRLLDLHNGIFCDPRPDVKELSFGQVEEMVRNQTGIKYAFSGMKGVDGFMKRMRLKLWAKDDWINPKGMVYPLALWTNPEVLRFVSKRNLIKPFSYGKSTEKQLGQGFVMAEPQLLYLIKNYPEDYDKVVREFPYVETLMYQYLNKQN